VTYAEPTRKLRALGCVLKLETILRQMGVRREDIDGV
jgi:hypothetical protein